METDQVLYLWLGNQSRRRKNSEFKSALPHLKINLVSYLDPDGDKMDK